NSSERPIPARPMAPARKASRRDAQEWIQFICVLPDADPSSDGFCQLATQSAPLLGDKGQMMGKVPNGLKHQLPYSYQSRSAMDGRALPPVGRLHGENSHEMPAQCREQGELLREIERLVIQPRRIRPF